MARRGWAGQAVERHDMEWHGRLGGAWLGMARLGAAAVARQGAACSGLAWRGRARRGKKVTVGRMSAIGLCDRRSLTLGGWQAPLSQHSSL